MQVLYRRAVTVALALAVAIPVAIAIAIAIAIPRGALIGHARVHLGGVTIIRCTSGRVPAAARPEQHTEAGVQQGGKSGMTSKSHARAPLWQDFSSNHYRQIPVQP